MTATTGNTGALITLPYSAVQGKALGRSKEENTFSFTMVTTDNRTLQKGGLFVALVGTKLDGHAYIPAALDAGAGAVFLNKDEYAKQPAVYDDLAKKYPWARLIMVPGTLKALQDGANHYIQQFPDLIRIGITGSFGKTTTKEILASIMSTTYPTIYNQGNLNSETGLPLSVFHITRAHKIGIFELGMNRPGEIKETATVLNPHYALITNIGSAHIGFFGSLKRIAEEKKNIFTQLTAQDVAIIPEDTDFADFLAEGVAARVILYGDASKVGVTNVEDKGLGGTVFDYEGKSVRFPLPGMFNLNNALGAITLARDLGLDADAVRAGLEKVRPLFGRGETLKGSITVIQDCYNASPDTMSAALNFFQELDCTGKKVLVLGDMLELGDESARAHKKVIAKALETNAGLILLLGMNMAEAAVAMGLADELGPGGFYHQTIDSKTLKLVSPFDESEGGPEDLYVFESADDADIAQAADVLNTFLREGDLVLLKASRGLAMERITERLQGLPDERRHE